MVLPGMIRNWVCLGVWIMRSYPREMRVIRVFVTYRLNYGQVKAVTHGVMGLT